MKNIISKKKEIEVKALEISDITNNLRIKLPPKFTPFKCLLLEAKTTNRNNTILITQGAPVDFIDSVKTDLMKSRVFVINIIEDIELDANTIKNNKVETDIKNFIRIIDIENSESKNVPYNNKETNEYFLNFPIKMDFLFVDELVKLLLNYSYEMVLYGELSSLEFINENLFKALDYSAFNEDFFDKYYVTRTDYDHDRIFNLLKDANKKLINIVSFNEVERLRRLFVSNIS